MRCLIGRFREQARSHIWNAFPCGSEPAREEASGNNLIIPTLCVGMQPVTLRVTTMFDNTASNGWNAERPERHSHAERGNDQQNANPKVGVLFSSSSV